MSQICVPTVFPEFTAIYLAVRELTARLPNFSIPMPTVPTPFFSDMHWPTLQAINFSIELVTFSILNFLYQLCSPILAFLKAFGADIPWPKVPVLDIDLPTLLALDMAALVLIVKGKFPDLSKFYALVPLLPSVLFSGITFPALQIIEAIQALIKSFIVTMTLFVVTIFNLVKSIVNAKPFNLGLSLPNFPTLPTDWASLIALVGLPDIDFSLPNIDIGQLFSGLSIPGFPGFDLSFDFPGLFPDLNAPSITFYQMMKLVFLALVLVVTKLFKTVADALSSIIGFSFPQICVPVVSV